MRLWFSRAESAQLQDVEIWPPHATQAENYSGVVISNDLQTNCGRFLIIDNGRKIDVQIGVPPADPAVHGGKVVRLHNQDAGATRHIMPAAKQLPSCREFIRSLLWRH